MGEVTASELRQLFKSILQQYEEMTLLQREIVSELRHQNKLLSKTEPVLLSKSKTAHLLGLSTATIDRLTREGILTPQRVGGQKYYNRKQVLNAVR